MDTGESHESKTNYLNDTSVASLESSWMQGDRDNSSCGLGSGSNQYVRPDIVPNSSCGTDLLQLFGGKLQGKPHWFGCAESSVGQSSERPQHSRVSVADVSCGGFYSKPSGSFNGSNDSSDGRSIDKGDTIMITTIFTIISALLPVVLDELEKFKTISPTTGSLITGITGAASTFAATISSGTASTITAMSILTAISATLQVLKAELPTDGTATAILVYIAALESAVAAGLASTDITSVDATKLIPVTPV
jgi:hypothetical protein